MRTQRIILFIALLLPSAGYSEKPNTDIHQKVDSGRKNEESGSETRTTKSGHAFTRNTSYPKLGEAWQDPTGMIWGDLVKTEASPILNRVSHQEADDYCQSIGAVLPKVEDFKRLREYMGANAGSPEGYEPQILPNLKDHKFWNEGVSRDYDGMAYYFNGTVGNIGISGRGSSINQPDISARCVIPAIWVEKR